MDVESMGRAVWVVAVAWTVAGCAEPQPGKTVTHAEVCEQSNDQQRVTIEGYLTARGMLTFCSHGTCSMSLRQDKDAEEPQVTVGIRPGSGKNKMAELTKNFSEEDLSYTLSNGSTVGNLAHVRVTGKALAGEGCQLVDADLIESAG